MLLLTVMPPVKVFVPLRRRSPVPAPSIVRCFDVPEISLEMMILLEVSIVTTLSVALASAMLMRPLLCVGLSVKSTLLLLRRITLFTLLTVAPLRVSVPFVLEELFPMVTAPLVRAEEISIAPTA